MPRGEMLSLTENQLSILAVLFHEPDGEVHFRELARRIGKEAGAIQKALESLEAQGFVESRRRGNQRLIRINQQHSLAAEVRAIVEKSAGVAFMLRDELAKLPGIRTSFIFGSYAKGKYGCHSDIDVVVVGDARSEPALMKTIDAMEKKIGREINYKWYTPREFKDRLSVRDPFLEEVLGDKYVMLKGSI